MTFAQAQFGNHLAASNASGARGHPISTTESLPENPLIHPQLGLSDNQDFHFQNCLCINQLTGRAPETLHAARVFLLGKEEATGTRGTRPGDCFLIPPGSSLQVFSARTHSTGSLPRGRHDTGSPARLDQGRFRPVPDTAGASTASNAGQTGSSRFGKGSWKARCSSMAALPEPGELGRGRKREQPLVMHAEVGRK